MTVSGVTQAPWLKMSQNVARYWERRFMLNPDGKQSPGWHLAVAPNWIHQNHCLKICETGPCSKPASTAVSPSSAEKSQGFGTTAVIVDAGKGAVCREGCLLSCFVKCKTWNRSPHFRPWPVWVRADQSRVQQNNYLCGAFMLHLPHVSLLTKASAFFNNAGANCYAFVARQTLCTIFSLASLPSLQAAGVLGCTLKSRATSFKADPQIAQSSQHSKPL